MSNSVPPLTFGTKLSFGFGQVAEGVKTAAFGTFLLFYYNQVLGLSGDLAGLAIFFALIFDAVTDPIAGSISDRWQSPRGRRHPFMYSSALPLALSFIGLFAPLVSIEGNGETALFAWMLVFTIATRASITLYHVPHMAVGAELSEDYDERTILVAFRHFFGAVGYLVVFFFGYGYYFAASEAFPNGQLNADAYPPFAIVMGVIMVISIWQSAWGTRKRVPYMPKARETEARVTVKDVVTEAYQAMRNRSFRWMMFGFILIIAAWGMTGSLGLYVYTFFWQLTGMQILVVSILGPIGSMFGYLFTRVYFGWLDKRDAMIVAGLVWMVVHSIPVLGYMAGVAPEFSTWSAVAFLGIAHIFVGISVGQVVVGIGTCMADIADENELETGRRQEGVFFGASAFANKCAAGLGTLLGGIVLELISWPTGSAIRSAADIPADTIFQLAFIAGPIIALMAIPGVLCLRGYALNRDKMSEIQDQLLAKQAS